MPSLSDTLKKRSALIPSSGVLRFGSTDTSMFLSVVAPILSLSTTYEHPDTSPFAVLCLEAGLWAAPCLSLHGVDTVYAYRQLNLYLTHRGNSHPFHGHAGRVIKP
jgi:hypothetical protein